MVIQMKKLKLYSILLVIIFVFSVHSAFFCNAFPRFMGDIDNSGKIEASDARTVLRAAVGLDRLSAEETDIADIDKNGKLSAADARFILRMSVGLEKLQYAQDISKESYFEVHFIDVGQADCSLILCDGESLLIDGGNVADSSLVVAYLLSEGVEELDYVICTHAHEDHVGGLSGPLNKFTVTEAVFAPETGADTDCYEDFIKALDKQNMELTVPENGYTFSLGESTVEFVGPVTEDYADINNTSLVTKITYGETSFLFTGDAERESENDILDAGFNVSADVLKVGHHGSENSTTYRFLREVSPEIAVISVGSGNKYGHPTEEALSRLRDADVKVYRTDMQGHIKITSDGQKLTVTTNKNQNIETNPTKPAPTPENYIGNKNSKIFHLPTCSSLPKESNRVYFSSREQAINEKYNPCSRCDP